MSLAIDDPETASVAFATGPGATAPGTIVMVPGGSWLLTDDIVSLLPLTEEHIPAAAAACADPHARRMLAHAVDLRGSAEQRRTAVTDYLLGPWRRVSVEPFAVAVADQRRKDGLKVIGVRFLEHEAPGRRLFSCGGWITARERQRGYGSRALRLACAYAEAVHDAAAVATATRTDNVAAQENLRAAGFHRVRDDERPFLERESSDLPARLEEWVRITADPTPLRTRSRRRPPKVR